MTDIGVRAIVVHRRLHEWTFPQGRIWTKVATGGRPDFAFWQPHASQLGSVNAHKDLLPLDKAFLMIPISLRDVISQGFLKKFGLLLSAQHFRRKGVYYNKKVFAVNGITGMPKNWNEFIEIAQTLTSKGLTLFYNFGHSRRRVGTAPYFLPIV